MITTTNDLPPKPLAEAGYYYDDEAADRAVSFFPRYLRHTKGIWAGKPFELLPWQADDIVAPIFGWKRADGTRRFRMAYIEIPRKNGKTTLGAGLALYLLLADGEYGAEVYSAAADREQAGLVFGQARDFVDMSPKLAELADTYKFSITYPRKKGTYKRLSAEAYTKHGLNASGIVFDELHAQPSRDLFDVLNTSTGARKQPLMIMITTAGYDRESICYQQREYALSVANGVIDDPSYFCYVAAAAEADDWTEPDTWAAANPNYGVTIDPEYLERECLKAQEQPAYQNTFRRLHLNQWTSQESRWIDLNAWDLCDGILPDLRGRVCYGGMDLASTIDIAALVLCFPPTREDEPYYLLPRFWIPEDNMIDRARRDRVPYDAWSRDNLVTATEGNVIDYRQIRHDINRLVEQYEIREIAYDRYGAEQLRQDLADDGLEMVQFGQTWGWFSAPSKEFERLVLSRRIAHGGNAPLRWMVNNVQVKMSAEGDIKPDKAKSREKIDGVVAAIMALDRALRHSSAEPGASAYNDRGVLFL